MKPRHIQSAGVCLSTLAWLVLASAAGAQERQPLVKSTFEFIAGEPVATAIVRGAPYSAEATTTMTQMLADGTRIERTTVTKVFRDGEGRVRREQTVLGLGPLTPTGESATVITITDPIAGESYVLEPESRKARRTPLYRVQGRGGAGDRLAILRQDLESAAAPPPPPAPPSPADPPGPRARGRIRQGSETAAIPSPPPPPPPPVGESLGTKRIDGIDAVGTRYTATIEAGRIGNDRPIEIVDERWESPTLKVLVQSRHSDPRSGVVEYRLTNITRAEPPHDLFVVPSDYTILPAREEPR